MQEVWIFTETVAILCNIVKYTPLASELLVPLVRAVVGLGGLKAAKNVFVAVSYASDLFNSDRAIQ